MNIAILQPQAHIADWFRQTHPEIAICEVADGEFMGADCLMIQASYEIDGEYYQILDLWKRYLEVRNKRKKLLILGSSPSPSPNLILSHQLSDDLLNQVQKAQIIRSKPLYPDLVHTDILPALGRILQSHGERAFQRSLIQARPALRAVERALKKMPNPQSEELRRLPVMQDASLLMDQLHTVWRIRKGFFSLMPHYSDLSRFDDLWQQWEQLRYKAVLPDTRLSIQLGIFLDEVVTDVTSFYKMEQFA